MKPDWHYWGTFVDLGAALATVLAGVYLLQQHGVPIDVGGASGQSWFEVLAHGIGVYFIARGVWMFRHIGLEQRQVDSLERLVEIEGGWDADEERPAATVRRVSDR